MDRSVHPHEIVSVLEHVSLDAHDRGRIERMSLMQLDRTKDSRLSGDRSVIALQGKSVEAIQFHIVPVDPDRLVEGFRQTVWSLNDILRAGHPA